MRNGIAISSMLHVGVVLATIYGLPELMRPLDVVEQPIIVELVTISERTVTQKPPEPKLAEKKAPPPAPKLKPIATPKPEPKPEPEPEAKPEPVKAPPPPPPPEPVQVAAPPPPPEPVKAEAVVAPPPPEPEKPKEKPKPPKKPPIKVAAAEPAKAFRTLPRPRTKPKRQRPKFSTDRIAALLDKDQEKKPQPSERRKPVKKRKSFKDISIPPAPAQSRTSSVPMTMSEIDAIRYQIQQCWSIPAGARDAENLVVRIKVYLNTDGSLSKAPEIVGSSGGGGTSDPFYRTAAESARRAVLKCAPLKNLPVDKYARWREITLTFNPREMLGG